MTARERSRFTPNDYLNPSDADLEAMWTSIRSRSAAEEGKRQEPFTPLESLICFGLGLATPPSPSGVINIKKTDPRVVEIAGLFKRPVKSLILKYDNLVDRPGRNKGAKSEREVGAELTENPELFASLFARILDISRADHAGATAIPDFLGVGDGRFRVAYEADTVSDDALRETLHEAGADKERNPETEAWQVRRARLTQRRFSWSVLEQFGFACGFCGLSPATVKMRVPRMLVAGHIKPWRDSDPAERTSQRNGVAACPTHDAAFEGFLLAVEDSGTILQSRQLQRATREDSSWRAAFATVGERLAFVRDLPAPEFLSWHRLRAAEHGASF